MQTLFSQALFSSISATTIRQATELIDHGLDPQLAAVLVGDNPESLRYIAIKTERAKEAGIILSVYHLDESSSMHDVEESIRYLAKDTDIHGIILQLPLPAAFSAEQTDCLLDLIPSHKDVDGLRGDWLDNTYADATLGSLLLPQSHYLPPMVAAVTSLLDHYGIDIRHKKIVLVGAGRLVGTPLFQFYDKLGLDVQTVDEETPQIFDITSQADILISGTGQKELITYQWVKEGAVVIDCATDIHVDSVAQVASALAPPKGGVGPLTIAWLLHNTVQAAHNYQKELQ
jgi:methylenetetrahydrofolate dehydrogenase (NADP+)/methenyltetrahydrofolate cyclohydrolase